MILFYNPPSSASKKPVLPKSLLALGAIIEGSHDYEILDGNLIQDAFNTLSRYIKEKAPKVLALTVMPGPQLEHAVKLCPQIKEAFPDLIILWGGYFATQHWEVVVRSNYVDYVLRGHCEYCLLYTSPSPRDLSTSRMPSSA